MLDVPCGQGRHAHLLAEAGYNVDGLDYSEHLLKIARRRGTGPSLRYTRGDMRKLPARWSGETIRIAGKKFAADKYVPVFIFPNPLNPKRYVVVNSGFTFCEYGRSSNALQIPKLPDYAVLDMTVDRKGRYPNGVALAGFFDETWGL